MKSEYITSLTATETARLIARREVSPVEVTMAYLDRIANLNPVLNAYISVCGNEALAAAKVSEDKVCRGEPLGLLEGVPYGAKDQFLTRGIRTTCASTLLRDYIPSQDATAVTRMREAGAVLLGKHNMTEFAGGQGDPYKYGEPKNPWNLERFTGSSSSGSGVAVASGLCAAALGEDTGGSGRCPASHCGVVGLRPTWGLVSRNGVLPISWSQDAVAPMTHTVEDAALLLTAVGGYDPLDRLVNRAPQDYRRFLKTDLPGLRVGILRQYMSEDLCHSEVLAAVRRAAETLASLGATVEEASFPLMHLATVASAIVTGADMAFVHRSSLRSSPSEYGPWLRRHLYAGSLIPSHLLVKAERLRAFLRHEWTQLFLSYDVLIGPTMPTPPQIFPYLGPAENFAQAEQQYSDPADLTVAAAFLGTPALSLPCGFSSEQLPIGFQIFGSHFREDLILRAGYAYQQHTQWHMRRPPIGD